MTLILALTWHIKLFCAGTILCCESSWKFYKTDNGGHDEGP